MDSSDNFFFIFADQYTWMDFLRYREWITICNRLGDRKLLKEKGEGSTGADEYMELSSEVELEGWKENGQVYDVTYLS